MLPRHGRRCQVRPTAVLPDRGLRVRPRWSAIPPRWSPPMRQGAWRRQASAQQCRFLLVSAAGAELQGKDHRPCQCRRDTTNAIKQAAEFGIVSGRTEARGHAAVHHDVHALGLKVAQGLNFTETFYWDMNDKTAPSPSASTKSTRRIRRPWFRPASIRPDPLFKALEALGAIRMTASRWSPR